MKYLSRVFAVLLVFVGAVVFAMLGAIIKPAKPSQVIPRWMPLKQVNSDYRLSIVSVSDLNVLESGSKVCVDTRGYSHFLIIPDSDGRRIPALETSPRVFVVDAGVTVEEATAAVCKALGFDKYCDIGNEGAGPFANGTYRVVRKNETHKGYFVEGFRKSRPIKLKAGDILSIENGIP